MSPSASAGESIPTTHEQAESTGEPVSPLLRSRSFLSFLATQALGAFNDNVFKQMVLLLSVGYVTVANADFQSVVQFLFALPFLVFSGLAGDLADRYSKGRIMVLCKVAEIGVMGVGMLVFMFLVRGSETGEPPFGLWLLAGVTFLMGCQSAFFGPPKYGGLPELVRQDDLAQAVGLTQMTTFLAIIFGVMLAGFLVDWLQTRLWVAGLLTVGLAVIGTLTSLGIARVRASDAQRRIGGRSLLSVLPTLRRVVATDRLLVAALILYSFFWLVGGVALPSLNVYGRLQLGLNNFETSILISTLSLGIAFGSAAAARLSQKKVRIGLIVPGMTGMAVCLTAMLLVPAHTPTDEDMEQFRAGAQTAGPDGGAQIVAEAPASVQLAVSAILILLGAFSGLMSVPVLAFVQARPAGEAKGQVFALANWLSWLFIVGSAGVYYFGISWTGYRADLLLAAMGVVTAVVGIVLAPLILRGVRTERPDFVWTKP